MLIFAVSGTSVISEANPRDRLRLAPSEVPSSEPASYKSGRTLNYKKDW